MLNVRNFALSPNALAYLYDVSVEFLREPVAIKLGLPQPQLDPDDTTRTIKLAGLNLNGQGSFSDDLNSSSINCT